MKKKISILLPNLVGGGAERVSLDLGYEFKKMGHEVEFVVFKAMGALLNETKSNFNIVDLKISRSRSLPFVLANYIKKNKPNSLLVAMWPLTVIAPIVNFFLGHPCKLVVSEHGILSSQYRDWGKLHNIFLRLSTIIGYRFANSRIGVSAGVVSDMSKLSCIKKDKFRIIYNPIPIRSSHNHESLNLAEKLWGVPKGSRILTVGRMKDVKNHSLLLYAFAKIKSYNHRLMFVGDGDKMKNNSALAKKLGVSDHVIFAGFHSDPSPFYKTADLFVLSSNNEGFGNVIVEALQAGISVVSTDCPSGPREILKDGLYGKLVPLENKEELAKAMIESLEKPINPEIAKLRAKEFLPSIAAKAYIEELFN